MTDVIVASGALALEFKRGAAAAEIEFEFEFGSQ